MEQFSKPIIDQSFSIKFCLLTHTVLLKGDGGGKILQGIFSEAIFGAQKENENLNFPVKWHAIMYRGFTFVPTKIVVL